jgi:hypothetical protein
MGLDMYLEGRKYFSRVDWDNARNVDGKYVNDPQYDAIMSAAGMTGLDREGSGGLYVSFSAGYWRKQNAIHDWFVKTIGNNIDECQEMWVSREHLEQLKTMCQLVLTVPVRASEFLPTQDGFFFGSTEYDEWYFQGLIDTIGIIDHCLSLPDDIQFYYQASW